MNLAYTDYDRESAYGSTEMIISKTSGTRHPTKQKLIAAFLDMGDGVDFGKITVDAVLEKSGVSKGSLYHHFADFDDLMAEAMAQAFSAGVDHSIDLIGKLLEKSETVEDFQLLFRTSVLDTLRPEGVRHRLMRAYILGISSQYPKLRSYVAYEQHRLTTEIEDIFKIAQEKGLVKKDLDLHVASVFIQAYTFGKITDDLSEAPVDPYDWADWIVSILTYKILA